MMFGLIAAIAAVLTALVTPPANSAEAQNPTTPPAAIIAHQELLPVVEPLPPQAPATTTTLPPSPDPGVWVVQDGYCVNMPQSLSQANGETTPCVPDQALPGPQMGEAWVIYNGYCIGEPIYVMTASPPEPACSEP